MHRRACAEGNVLSAHRKHVVHPYNIGRVEAQRLVERKRFLPRGKPGHMGEKVRLADGGTTTCAAGNKRRLYRRAEGRAHIKHLSHGRDA